MAGDHDGSASPRLAEARKAHSRGWALTPLNGKVPTTKGWSKAPKPDLATVEQMARNGNVGLRTGEVSGVIVLDDDTPDSSGAAALRLPPTPTVITGSGKRHYYFRRPAAALKNSVKTLRGVDVRAEGGQVVYVGSIHPDTGKPYIWADGLSPEDVPLAELPACVLAMLGPRSKQAKPKPAAKSLVSGEQERLKRYAQVALQSAATRIADAPEGTRNDRLNAEAFSLGRFVGLGVLTREEILQSLTNAAERSGLTADEARRTIESGMKAGTEAPDAVGDTLRKLQGPARGVRLNRKRVVIQVDGGELPSIVDQAEDALMSDGGEELFQYGNQVVRLVRTTDPFVSAGVMRPFGAVAIRPVDVVFLVERLTLAADFVRPTRDGPKSIDCPEKVAKTYLSREGDWKLRRLTGVIEAPTLRFDGSVLDQPGFDQVTGLYFDPGDSKFPAIPESCSIDDARGALERIEHVLKDFPFVDDSDRSAAVAAILTAVVRRSLRTAPIFTFSAPMPGSGKSLLADIVSMVATGRPCAVMSQGRDENEDKKRLLSLLLDGESVACIDNIDRPLGGAALCSALTQTRFKDRLLGHSKTAIVSTAVTFLATGNNLVLVGDLTTRAVPCDLDAKCERPEERAFEVNLYKDVPAHRGELIVAALTILRAYWIADRPKQDLSVFGRFEDWSQWVRSPIVWLGRADPCGGRARLAQADPVREILIAVLTRWHSLFGEKVQTVAEVVQRATVSVNGPEDEANLYEALVTAAPSKTADQIDKRKLGRWLHDHLNRVEGGLRIERAGSRQNTALWRVVRVTGTTSLQESPPSLGASPFMPSGSEEDGEGELCDDANTSTSEPTREIPPKPQIPPIEDGVRLERDADDVPGSDEP